MEAHDDIEWPVEMLGRILHFLAMDGAESTWKKLAFLTHKSSELINIAERMQKPLVLRVGFDGQGKNNFVLPFQKATVAQVEIDWGDDSPTQIVNSVEKGYVEHFYDDSEHEYAVRVFPHGSSLDSVWLDHIGWDLYSPSPEFTTSTWWRPLREFRTLGRLGISSLEGLFLEAYDFNLPLNHVDVSNIKNMSDMLREAEEFNQPLDRWNVSNVTKMRGMFAQAKNFNQLLVRWNVSNVERMDFMFFQANAFNQPLGEWDTSNVLNMRGMFQYARSFNQDVSSWSVSKVTDMSQMFRSASSFNQPLGSWDVRNVTQMQYMFDHASSFNQPIGAWDTRSVTKVAEMFLKASAFNQDISGWDLTHVAELDTMLDCESQR